MSNIQFANNANSTLAGTLSSGTTSCTVATGEGALFPTLTGSNYFLATIVDAATGLVNEIVKVTARSGDVMTIVRAQEGTTAHNWNSGDLFENNLTAGTAAAFLQTSQSQAFGAYAVDTGAADAMVITLSPAPASLTDLIGVPLRIKVAATNLTDTPTLNVNGLGAQNIVIINTTGTASFGAGTATIAKIITVIWDGSHFQYNERLNAAGLTLIQLGINNSAPVTPFGLNISFNASTPFSNSSGNSDFQTFPNGLYLVWGNYTMATGSNDLITLPLTLPNGMMSVTALPDNGANVDVLAIGPNGGAPNSQLRAADQRWTGTTFTAQAGVLIRWFVVGW